MKKIYLVFICFFYVAITTAFGQCTINYLTNPSFEAPIQPLLNSNNFPAPYDAFGGWTIPSASPTVQVGGFNIVRVDGAGYSGGPNTAHGTGNQYVDINGAGGYVQQSFTITCTSTIEYSGWFSRREPGGSGFTSYMDIINSANTVVSTSSTVSFTSGESEETWKQVTGTISGLAAGTYTLRFFMDDYANIDDAFLCVSPGCVLATTLSNVSATAVACNAKLSWLAAAETALKQYDVQYSSDGISFLTVSTILPKNSATSNSYNYSYTGAKEGAAFFRIKAIDEDNKFTYSKIVSANINCNKAAINVYPNPVTDNLHVTINNNKQNKTLIYNAAGKLMQTNVLTNTNNDIDFNALPKGLYIVKILTETSTKVFKITKM